MCICMYLMAGDDPVMMMAMIVMAELAAPAGIKRVIGNKKPGHPRKDVPAQPDM